MSKRIQWLALHLLVIIQQHLGDSTEPTRVYAGSDAALSWTVVNDTTSQYIVRAVNSPTPTEVASLLFGQHPQVSHNQSHFNVTLDGDLLSLIILNATIKDAGSYFLQAHDGNIPGSDRILMVWGKYSLPIIHTANLSLLCQGMNTTELCTFNWYKLFSYS